MESGVAQKSQERLDIYIAILEKFFKASISMVENI